jgi:predicted transcriptional regulator
MSQGASTYQPRVGSAGTLLKLIRSGKAATRSDLAEITGLARSTVTQRVELLMAAGFISEVGDAPSTGGRPCDITPRGRPS